MKISVLTPTYNCAQFILRSYSCLISQTYSDWEWILVDDGSTDETEKIVQILIETDRRIKYFRYSENKGRGFARNLSMQKASGDIFAVWDIDDFYTKDRFECIYDAIITHGFDYFYSDMLLLDSDLNIKSARGSFEGDANWPNFTHATLAFNANLSSCLKYNISMRAGEDLEMMVILYKRYKGFHCDSYLFLYVEEREINLKKTIQMNNSHKNSMKSLISNQVIDVNGFQEFKIRAFFLFKSLILLFLQLMPRIYLLSVRFRKKSSINPLKLKKEHLDIIRKFYRSNSNVS